MLTKSRISIATALATTAVGATPALATPGDPVGVRGEYAVSLSDRAVSESPGPDLRTDAARERFVQPVVVEVDDPVATRLRLERRDHRAGARRAVLAGVGVTGTRRRHAGARIA